MIFSVMARDSELQKLFIHTVWPCLGRGSTSFRTIAVVLLVSAVIKRESMFVSLPVYARKDHNYPMLASHSSDVSIPNLDALR
jgi:hypothetical protein